MFNEADLPQLPGVLFMVFLAVLLVWSTVWKGIALWMAARRGQSGWYVVLLIVNTVGILEMIYVFLVAPRHAEIGRGAEAAATG